jgi:3-dehydroquinate synthase
VPTDRISVEIPGAHYDVYVRRGLLQQAAALLRSLSSSPRAAVITDSNVAALHLHTLVASLSAVSVEAIAITLPAGESHKELATLRPAYDALLAARIDRNTPVLTLGGGVVGDMGGFLAATLLRGLPLIPIPTTLLAMVDASFGGKTGVNHREGKNLIGAFHQPLAVLADPELLKTLPAAEIQNGLAECIKHEMIRDADGFADLEANVERALRLDLDYLTPLVAHNVGIKARIVAADPFERGERAHLNFGHTFGHAIEKASAYSLSHGQSVALGLVAASTAATTMGLLDRVSRGRVVDLIRRAGLPAGGLEPSTDEILDAMGIDKKTLNGKIRFVLPDRIGNVVVRDDVPTPVIRDAIDQLRG